MDKQIKYSLRHFYSHNNYKIPITKRIIYIQGLGMKDVDRLRLFIIVKLLSNGLKHNLN